MAPTIRWALPAALVAAVLGVFWLREHSSSPPPSHVPNERAADGPATVSADLLGVAAVTGPAAARRALAAPEPEAAPAASLDDEELIAALERLARVIRPEGIVVTELEDALRPFVFSHENIERVIELLREGRLGGGEELTPAERGAISALHWAALIHNHAVDDPRFLVAGIDGDLLVRDVLELVGEVTPAVRDGLLHWLRRAMVDDRPLLTIAYLDDLLALRARYPDLRAEYSELITKLGGDLDPNSRRAFYSLFLSETEDPTVVKFALSRLLEEGGDVERLLAWAQQRIDLENDPVLRKELLQAVAASAPPQVAARFLERNIGAEQYAASFALGLRSGGIDALGKSYDELLAMDASPERRRMLVSGMIDADPATLLGIADIDPDPRVRGQALVTATAGSEVDAAAAKAVRQAWDQRGAQGAIPAYDAMLAAANMAHTGLTASIRADGVAILEEAVRDNSQPTYLREQALGFLDGLMPKEEHELLALELNAH